MGCAVNSLDDESEKDDNTPGLTEVYFDKSLSKPKINSKTLVSNFKIKYTLTKGCKGVTCLFQLPMGNTVTNSGHGSINIWSTKFDSIIDTKKLFGHHITDMLLIAQRIFIAICGEEKMMKAYYVTNDFEKIFDTELDYSPIKLHGVNLLKEIKKFACAHKDGIIIYQCWDRVSKREDEIAMDEYDKYLHKEENPIIHTLIVEEIMSLYIPNAEINFCVLMNGHSFAFNSLFLIKIWKFKKEEKINKKEKKIFNFFLKEFSKSIKTIFIADIHLRQRANIFLKYQPYFIVIFICISLGTLIFINRYFIKHRQYYNHGSKLLEKYKRDRYNFMYNSKHHQYLRKLQEMKEKRKEEEKKKNENINANGVNNNNLDDKDKCTKEEIEYIEKLAKEHKEGDFILAK